MDYSNNTAGLFDDKSKRMGESVIRAVNNFRYVRGSVGYTDAQVDEFLESLVDMVKQQIGSENNEISGESNKISSKKEQFDADYSISSNKVITLINDVKFTQGFTGYDTTRVDVFLDDLINIINQHRAHEKIRTLIDTNIITEAKFSNGFRGYDISEVDEYLDMLSDEIEKLNEIKLKYL